MKLFDIFRTGAKALSSAQMRYASVHADYGINQDDWDTITSDEVWTVRERQKIRSILTELINISMTISGIPAQPLPSQYVAAIICEIIHPCNRLVACSCTPETYDGELSSGLLGTSEIKNVPITTMISLVLAYSSDIYLEPTNNQISKTIEDQSVTQVTKTKDEKSKYKDGVI